ncbi:flagellar assembly protein FliW [Paenibacillus sp. M1]|uniref:Flagellar assembly factor FliW n=1 Tax=Paenibacillus haidiansis TaxID=1574488 RepID=A0ABU7VWD5_9BACL
MVTQAQSEVKVSEDEVYTFRKGIPGFEQYSEFTIFRHDEHFSFLQSMEEEEVAFIIINPFSFFPDYEFELSDTDLEELHINSESEVAVRTIVTWGDELTKVTTNLMAPLVFNVEERIGKQIVLNRSNYTTKHFLHLGGRTTAGGDSSC